MSPLPPEKSGIADYSTDLLPELAEYYDIDVVVAQDAVDGIRRDPRITVRSVEWFDGHAAGCRRILYHLGSSDCHRHMPELLSRYPGIVVLHDFFLGELFDCRHPEPDRFPRILFEAHGYRALIGELRHGRKESIRAYPCNGNVLNHASGMIVHSRFSMRLADQWHGPGATEEWRYIPIPKPVPGKKARQDARHRLGIEADDFVVASFGFVVPFKLNDRLIDAWSSSPMSQDAHCRLIFVGECGLPDYAEALQAANRHGDRIAITGFVDRETYRAHLEAADIAVQLRLDSRGETSAAILDCLAYGIPTIVNAHGSAAELPGNALIKLVEEFSQTDLRDAITLLWRDAGLRKKLSGAAMRHIRSAHDPARAACLYRDAIEHFARSPLRTGASAETSGCLPACERNRDGIQTRIPFRQILVDITDWMRPEERCMAQLRQMLAVLLDAPFDRYRVETVHWIEAHYAYARTFTTALLEIKEAALEDSPLEIRAGDIFLQPCGPAPGLRGCARLQFLSELEAHGIEIIRMPEWIFPPDTGLPEMQAAFMKWMMPILANDRLPLPTKPGKKSALNGLHCTSEFP